MWKHHMDFTEEKADHMSSWRDAAWVQEGFPALATQTAAAHLHSS